MVYMFGHPDDMKCNIEMIMSWFQFPLLRCQFAAAFGVTILLSGMLSPNLYSGSVFQWRRGGALNAIS